MTHNTLRRSIWLTLICFVIGTGWLLAAKPIFTQTYNLPAPVRCEGLDRDGVTYSFTVGGAPSLDCLAGTFAGPGITNNMSFPNIEGTSAGVLHLTFDVPTTDFGFGVARSITGPPSLTDSVIIDLFRPGAGLLREELLLDPTPDPNFVGGRFDYEGPAVKTVTIAFRTPPVTRFAIDNVTYFRPPGQSNRRCDCRT
jgi:hypothetical protein